MQNYMYLILIAICTNHIINTTQFANQNQQVPAQSRKHKLTIRRFFANNFAIDINSKTTRGTTVLMFAVWKGQSTITPLLIAAGADLDAKDEYGTTALMTATLNGHIIIVQQLIAAGVDFNAKNTRGHTALMMAALIGRMFITQQLIAAGADPAIKNENEENKAARDYAKDKLEYNKAVAAGLKEQKIRQTYHARQAQAKKIIEEQPRLIPNISDIIAGYAYGSSPLDLPEHVLEEKMSWLSWLCNTLKLCAQLLLSIKFISHR